MDGFICSREIWSYWKFINESDVSKDADWVAGADSAILVGGEVKIPDLINMK